MEEGQLADILTSLEQALPEYGLSSLVEQERSSAIEGKAERLSNEEIDEIRYSQSKSGSRRKSSVRADDVRLRPLTAGERLEALLDLIEVAVGGTYAIETRLRSEIKETLHDEEIVSWEGQVIFAAPPESATTGSVQGDWVLPGQEELQQRRVAVREVISLVNQLRERAELARSERLESSVDAVSTNGDSEIPGGW